MGGGRGADRVLEIGGAAAGFCGRLFVQSGHDVTRVEVGRAPESELALELYLHAGKRRVGTRDPDLIAQLAARADVVIAEAGTADGIDALGFDAWAAPVKVAITPFGRTGPKRNWQATPSVILAMGGYTNLMGDPERAPLTLPGHYVEFQSGGLAFTAANACRLAGQSSAIDVGMLEVVMASSQFTTVMWHCLGEIRSRHGNDFWSIAPTNLFRCADGWVYLNIVPAFWWPFVAFSERAELAVDERFKTNRSRMEHRDALNAIVAEVFAPLTRAQIQARADEARIPLGAVKSLAEVLSDPHLAERGVWQTVKHGTGAVRSPRPAWQVHGDSAPALELADVEVRDG